MMMRGPMLCGQRGRKKREEKYAAYFAAEVRCFTLCASTDQCTAPAGRRGRQGPAPWEHTMKEKGKEKGLHRRLFDRHFS